MVLKEERIVRSACSAQVERERERDLRNVTPVGGCGRSVLSGLLAPHR